MKRSVAIRLRDILTTIDAVAEMIAGRDLGQFRSDLQLRLAVERCVEIISEASRHIPPDAKATFPDVPWPEIAAIGNRLRHEYGVDGIIIWQVATRFLPELRPVVAAILNATET
jgi:uncharacterized protein with HEPN domain